MKKTMISTAVAAGIALTSASAFAADAPTVYGNLTAGVQKVQDTTDVDGTAFEATMGVKGKYSEDGFTLIYNLEAEFAENANNSDGTSELEVTNAKIVMPSKAGVFVVAPRTESGQQNDIYAPVDIFEYNAQSADSGLFAQPEAASAVLAYVTPTFSNTKVVIAALTLKNSGTATNYNDKDMDAYAVRVVHKADALHLAAGVVGVAKEQLPTDKNYTRYALGAGYDFGMVSLGAVYEKNDDHPAGDYNTTAVTADFAFNEDWSAGIGYTKQGGDKDDKATMAILRKQLLENAYGFAEYANYDQSSDNWSIGVNVSF